MRFLCAAKSRIGRLLMLALLGAALSSPAWAQCAMCREAAKSQRSEAIRALQQGIIVLAVPPAAIMVGIGFLVYRRRNFFQGGSAQHVPAENGSLPPEGGSDRLLG